MAFYAARRRLAGKTPDHRYPERDSLALGQIVNAQAVRASAQCRSTKNNAISNISCPIAAVCISSTFKGVIVDEGGRSSEAAIPLNRDGSSQIKCHLPLPSHARHSTTNFSTP
jgi:hypothetical protein